MADPVECCNEEAVEILLAAGANVNQESATGTALGSATTRNIALRLMNAGAHPKHLTSEGRRAILGYPSEPDEKLVDVSANEFQQGRSRRFGKHNPEKMKIPFWEGMIRSGINAYQGGKLFGDERKFDPGYMPIWCAQRFGQSITFLPDGRIVQVAGEHEDSYDPDFCIYNDVFVHGGNGDITIFGYPETAFPPTDFHTATLIGSHIYLIGSLGYPGTRQYGETPVYRLDINSFRMERLETAGNNPGWIYEHRAIQAGTQAIEVKQGTVVSLAEGEENHSPNMSIFVLDIERLVWRVKE
jgi:hypothetical protein